MSAITDLTLQRRRILVQGIVQGVGFRPFVYGLAQRLNLTGFVLNNSQGVIIEIEGSATTLIRFQQELQEQAPPLARIDSAATEVIPPNHDQRFQIIESQAGNERRALISPDSATCDDCLHELFDPNDRRYRYPFINCTNCGPRFTIVQDVPYDRKKTTMSIFPMCSACQMEYQNPLNRRFHAQPNACPDCGPQVSLLDLRSEITSPISLQTDRLAATAQLLAQGSIIAIKGLGGYHLACDALNDVSVQQLRQRKQREARPFAVMVPNLKAAQLLCEVSEQEARLLQSHRRPIVLLKKRIACPIARGVAPGNDSLGIMLPYTPLHFLLLHDFSAVIEHGRTAALVMTSGNLSSEPIAYQDEDARRRLAGIADGFLLHNRAIQMRCDDSVIRIAAGGEQLFRRTRGYAPEPLQLTANLSLPLLACGGHLKNTFSLGKARQVFISHHIGDLENLETLTSFREGIEHYKRLFEIYPEAIAYDLHPEYLATKYALETDIPQKIGVQHHHAHIASVLAEHGLSGEVIGIAADGAGFGTDGAIWGCEIMAADCADFTRLAHLDYIPLPGGAQAVHQPWRMAALYLERACGKTFYELPLPFTRQLDRSKWRILSQMAARGLNSPNTSSLGRLFDAVAALLGLRGEVQYEGQAAIELEQVAKVSPQTTTYPFTIHRQEHEPDRLDVLPMIQAIVEDIQRGVPVSRIAGRFHRSIAELLARAAVQAREQTGLDRIALSGGVFQNRLLLETLTERLEAQQFQIYLNRRVPPNDGGLSFGQLAVAAARLKNR